jgi:hypothetical protein
MTRTIGVSKPSARCRVAAANVRCEYTARVLVRTLSIPWCGNNPNCKITPCRRYMAKSGCMDAVARAARRSGHQAVRQTVELTDWRQLVYGFVPFGDQLQLAGLTVKCSELTHRSPATHGQ